MSTYTCAVVAAGSQGRVHAQGYLAAQALGARLCHRREGGRSRRRVPMPLSPVDNALLSGLAQGFWQPTGQQRSTY